MGYYKKTKKKLNIFPVIFVLILLIIFDTYMILGSINRYKTKKNYFEVIDKMNNLDNYSLLINVDTNLLSNGDNSNYNLTNKIQFDLENNFYHSLINIFNFQKEIYSTFDEENENNNKTYQNDNKKEWYIYNSEYNSIKINNIIDTLYNCYNIRKVKTNKLIKYKATIDTNKLMRNGFMKEIKKIYNLNLAELPQKTYLNVYVNKKNYIEKITFNLFKSPQNIKLKGKNYLFNNMDIKLSFSNLNQEETIVIPEDVLSNSVSYDQIIERKNNYSDIIYNEEEIMHDIVLGASTYCHSKTFNFEKYDGELDQYLSLDKYNIKNIKNGIMYIDDKCNVIIKEEFKIKNKICTYDVENSESCK